MTWICFKLDLPNVLFYKGFYSIMDIYLIIFNSEPIQKLPSKLWVSTFMTLQRSYIRCNYKDDKIFEMYIKHSMCMILFATRTFYFFFVFYFGYILLCEYLLISQMELVWKKINVKNSYKILNHIVYNLRCITTNIRMWFFLKSVYLYGRCVLLILCAASGFKKCIMLVNVQLVSKRKKKEIWKKVEVFIFAC